jgi:hypothetical protein
MKSRQPPGEDPRRAAPGGITPEQVSETYAALGRPGRPQLLAGRTRYMILATAALVAILLTTAWLVLRQGGEGAGGPPPEAPPGQSRGAPSSAAYMTAAAAGERPSR